MDSPGRLCRVCASELSHLGDRKLGQESQVTVAHKLQCAMHSVASRSYLFGAAKLGHFQPSGLGLAVWLGVTTCKCHLCKCWAQRWEKWVQPGMVSISTFVGSLRSILGGQNQSMHTSLLRLENCLGNRSERSPEYPNRECGYNILHNRLWAGSRMLGKDGPRGVGLQTQTECTDTGELQKPLRLPQPKARVDVEGKGRWQLSRQEDCAELQSEWCTEWSEISSLVLSLTGEGT